jgi:hypothetical protein
MIRAYGFLVPSRAFSNKNNGRSCSGSQCHLIGHWLHTHAATCGLIHHRSGFTAGERVMEKLYPWFRGLTPPPSTIFVVPSQFLCNRCLVFFSDEHRRVCRVLAQKPRTTTAIEVRETLPSSLCLLTQCPRTEAMRDVNPRQLG